MAGKIKLLIDEIINTRAQGNKTVENCVRTKLILKGIDPDLFDNSSDDDPNIIEKLQKVAEEYNVGK
ncbi:hypothetical protein KKC94_05635 [Patescibacteria group bacterium]|nr:hypothetical protein [Patescibacteria group bacterium]